MRIIKILEWRERLYTLKTVLSEMRHGLIHYADDGGKKWKQFNS